MRVQCQGTNTLAFCNDGIHVLDVKMGQMLIMGVKRSLQANITQAKMRFLASIHVITPSAAS